MALKSADEKPYCSCPTGEFYGAKDICGYCRTVAFFDDPDYAELMGFVLVGDKWEHKPFHHRKG